jgi:hypothetical protein
MTLTIQFVTVVGRLNSVEGTLPGAFVYYFT